MYRKDLNYNDTLRKVRVEIGTLLGLAKDDEAFLVLKELGTFATLKMKEVAEGDGQTAMLEYFHKILPDIIVQHNFYVNENTLMKNKEVADLLFEKLSVTTQVIKEYTSALFQPDRKTEGGDTVPGEDGVQESVQP